MLPVTDQPRCSREIKSKLSEVSCFKFCYKIQDQTRQGDMEVLAKSFLAHFCKTVTSWKYGNCPTNSICSLPLAVTFRRDGSLLASPATIIHHFMMKTSEQKRLPTPYRKTEVSKYSNLQKTERKTKICLR